MVQTLVINRGKLLKKIKLSAAALLDSLFQGVSREFSKAFDDELVLNYHKCSERECMWNNVVRAV